MSRLLIALLVAAATAAAGEGRKTPVGREVEAVLAEGDLVPRPAASDVLLSASAEGGIFGWASLRLDVWYPALDGHLNDQGSNSVTMSELGLDGNEITVVPRALLSFGGVGVLIDAFRFQTEGNGTLTGTFSFGGIDFTVSENVHSEVDLTNVRGLFMVRVLNTDAFRIFLMGGISYYDFNVTVTGQTSGTGSVSTPVPVPLLGVLGQAKVGPVLFEAEVSGLTANYGDFDITYLDLQASVGITFLKIVAVRAGYRLVSIDGTIEGYSVDGTLDGFFVGASVNF